MRKRSRRAKHHLLAIVRYVLDQPVAVEETRYHEFKEVKGLNPVRSIRKIVDEYVVAFLNREGGRIYWGIRDEDRVVVGVQLNFRQRDEVRRAITDQICRIQPALAPSAYQINFHEVHRDGQALPDLFVVEVVVPRTQTNLLYFTGANEVFVKTDAGKKRLSGLGAAGRDRAPVGEGQAQLRVFPARATANSSRSPA